MRRMTLMLTMLSLFLVPAGAFAGGSLKVKSHKGTTTVRVHTKGKPIKAKVKAF
ncbi:MAG TPA: hypothetical protein VND93_13315 [Myxococcales bacterium]|nr:hypothetical protein [Myxococcales bacterium]